MLIILSLYKMEEKFKLLLKLLKNQFKYTLRQNPGTNSDVSEPTWIFRNK